MVAEDHRPGTKKYSQLADKHWIPFIKISQLLDEGQLDKGQRDEGQLDERQRDEGLLDKGQRDEGQLNKG